jgi:hypothetical protein
VGTPDFDAEALQLASDQSLATIMRCHKAKRLRQLGLTDEEIALQCRIAVRLVDVAVETAKDRHEDFTDEDLAESLMYTLQQQLTGLQEIFRNPGWMYDVKGDALLGPDDQWQPNTERQLQAQREASRVIEGIRKLKGSDAPVRRHMTVEEIHRQETAIRVLATLRPDEIAGLDVVDGEIVYDGPDLLLGDGGVVDRADDQDEY